MQTSDLPATKLKCVERVLGEQAVLVEPTLSLARWTAAYYHHSLGEVFAMALPLALRKGKREMPETPLIYRLSITGQILDANTLQRAPVQRRIVTVLQQTPFMTVNALNAELQNWRAGMKRLIEQSLVEVAEQTLLPTQPLAHSKVLQQAPLPTTKQQHALDEISANQNKFGCYVLHGVTGSGKTEVYLRLAGEAIERGKQVLILVPEIALTPQLLSRFQSRLGNSLASIHSGLTDKETHIAWWLAKTGQVSVILGTRSAVFTPMLNPGYIIIDEEHDSSYKQQEGCRYHARDVAVKRASLENIPIVLGSATPSLETMHNALSGRYKLLTLPQRAAKSRLPDIGLIDLSKLKAHDGLSQPLVAAIDETLLRGEQSLIFLNRRGFATMVICFQCHWRLRCTHCDANMVLHQGRNRVRCHHCGADKPKPNQCTDCGNKELFPAGAGTQRVEQALKDRFREANVVRIDRDSTSRKGELEKRLAQAADGSADILVGTQMLSKGHHFPNVTTVGVVNVDQSLFSVDFRSAEQLYQLVTQVAGRAGRGQKKGTVYIQTAYPENEYFRLIRTQNFDQFVQTTLSERRQAAYPPLSYMVLLRANSKDPDAAVQFLRKARATALSFKSNVKITDAVDSPLAKKSGRYRAQLSLISNSRKTLHTTLDQLIDELENDKASRKVRWSVDVDPIDFY